MKTRIYLLALAVLAASAAARASSIHGTVKATGMKDSANAVVYIEKIDGKSFPAPKDPVVMNQKEKEFLPRVLPVLSGTTVNFLNSDPFNHNVFTPDKCADAFDLGSWPEGETRTHQFTKDCEAVLLCNAHPEMVGYIIVTETPYFAVTEADGSFTIDGVPDGTYELSVWHERLKKQRRTVTVKGSTKVDFELER